VFTLSIPSAGTWQLESWIRTFSTTGTPLISGGFYTGGTLVANSETLLWPSPVTNTNGAGYMSAVVTTTGAATYTVGLWTSGTGVGLFSDSTGRTKAQATKLDSIFALNALDTISTTGNVTVGGNLAVSGLLNLTTTANTNVDSQLVLQGNVYRGGAGYHDFLRVTNTNSGATNTNKFLRLDSTGQLQIINSAYTTNIFNLDNGGNLTVPGTITATSGVMAVPAWTSAGAITLTGTTTNPTKGTTTTDNISYRQLGAKQWEVVMTYIQSSGVGGANGSGDYLITLPNGLSFDTTLPSQPTYTSGVGSSLYSHLPYVIPNCNGTITNNTVGGQIFPMVYSATKFRILTLTYGSGIQPWGSGFYSATDAPKIQLTFRFTST
jgi:hypothetical protein